MILYRSVAKALTNNSVGGADFVVQIQLIKYTQESCTQYIKIIKSENKTFCFLGVWSPSSVVRVARPLTGTGP